MKTTSSENTESHACTVCGKALVPYLPEVNDSMTGESFSIDRCPGCGLCQTLPQPENMGRYYGKRYYGNRHGLTSRYCIKRRLGFVLSATGKRTKGRMLDMGCGDGSFLLAVKFFGWDVFGVEIQPESARHAGLEVWEDIQQASGLAPFDCITMWHSLEHMQDIQATLLQLAKLLSPSGVLIIAVPNNASIQSRIFKRRWLPLDVPRHLYHFDPESLSFGLENSGFIVRHHWHQELEYDLIGWSQSFLNCIFPTPNIFFDLVTGKRKNLPLFPKLLNLVLGSMLTALALPLVLIEKLCRRSGTLIICADAIQASETKGRGSRKST